MTNPLTLDERFAMMKHSHQTLELILSDERLTADEKVSRCMKIVQSAIYQTQVPVYQEPTLIPEINRELKRIEAEFQKVFGDEHVTIFKV